MRKVDVYETTSGALFRDRNEALVSEIRDQAQAIIEYVNGMRMSHKGNEPKNFPEMVREAVTRIGASVEAIDTDELQGEWESGL